MGKNLYTDHLIRQDIAECDHHRVVLWRWTYWGPDTQNQNPVRREVYQIPTKGQALSYVLNLCCLVLRSQPPLKEILTSPILHMRKLSLTGVIKLPTVTQLIMASQDSKLPYGKFWFFLHIFSPFTSRSRDWNLADAENITMTIFTHCKATEVSLFLHFHHEESLPFIFKSEWFLFSSGYDKNLHEAENTFSQKNGYNLICCA